MKLLWILLPAILLGIFLSSPAKAAVYTYTSCPDCSNKIASASIGDTVQLTASIPIPPLGSQANPYKINKPSSRVFNGYIPQNTTDSSPYGPGEFTLPANSKLYFEADPFAATGTSVGAFKFVAKFYSGGGTVCKLTQNKSTGAYSSEVCQGSDSYMDIVYNGQPYAIANTKFLYALVGSPDGDTLDAIWAVIPFVP
jgi:hypothetical protein